MFLNSSITVSIENFTIVEKESIQKSSILILGWNFW